MMKFHDPRVSDVFKNYPPSIRRRLKVLRELIFDIAAELKLGRIDETLKWNQPSYLIGESKSGTTIRLDSVKPSQKQFAIYVHCQTDLIGRFRELYPGKLKFEGTRAIVFDENDEIPLDEVSHFISSALTYHKK